MRFILGLFLLASSFYAIKMQNQKPLKAAEKISLIYPRLSKESVISYKSGARPYRTKGLRLEREYWKDKLIIHDYGHGGSGISLSWGSAEKSASLLKKAIKKGFRCKDNSAAILGGGVIGLATAHVLTNLGYKVTVYAKEFSPHTTSDLAPGLWNKVCVGENLTASQKQLLDKILKQSFRRFKTLASSEDPEFQGVRHLDVYTFKPRPPMRALADLGLIPEDMPVEATFEDGSQKKGFYFQTLLVDTSLYMPDLHEKAHMKGVRFVQKEFLQKDDLLELPETVIFNCTGYGSKTLFSDKDMLPIGGQLIELHADESTPKYMLAGPLQNDVDMYLIPLRDKTILGGSYQYKDDASEINPDICEKIFSQAEMFFHN